MGLPANVRIVILQGSTFQQTFTIYDDGGSPFNLTDWEVKAQLRTERLADDGGLQAEFTCTKPVPQSQGAITITIPFATAENISEPGFWDVEIRKFQDSGFDTFAIGYKMRPVGGYSVVSKEVTNS